MKRALPIFHITSTRRADGFGLYGDAFWPNVFRRRSDSGSEGASTDESYPRIHTSLMPGTVVVVPQQLFGQSTPCLSAIEDKSVTWSAKYDDEAHRWDVRADSFIDNPLVGTSASPSPSGAGSFIDKLVGTPNPSAAGAWAESLFAGTPQPQSVPRESVPRAYSWSVYERTKSILATGDDPLNQFC